jgi:pimeloyl-ACP methyl ester carboxylesterase
MPHSTEADRAVVSSDGTRIATSTRGDGPALVVVAGPFDVKSSRQIVALVDALADRFTVTTYDRRGRGESDPVLPDAVDREVEDLTAVIDDVGGSASVIALCAGSGVALHALAEDAEARRIDRAVVYEPSYVPGATRSDGARLTAELSDRVARGRLGAAIDLFVVDVLGLPRRVPAAARLKRSTWRYMLAGAPALPAEAVVMDGFVLPTEVFAAIDRPVLVVAGGDSTDRMKIAAQDVVRAVPGSEHTVLQDQQHRVDPAVLAPVAARFLLGDVHSAENDVHSAEGTDDD